MTVRQALTVRQAQNSVSHALLYLVTTTLRGGRRRRLSTKETRQQRPGGPQSRAWRRSLPSSGSHANLGARPHGSWGPRRAPRPGGLSCASACHACSSFPALTSFSSMIRRVPVCNKNHRPPITTTAAHELRQGRKALFYPSMCPRHPDKVDAPRILAERTSSPRPLSQSRAGTLGRGPVHPQPLRLLGPVRPCPRLEERDLPLPIPVTTGMDGARAPQPHTSASLVLKLGLAWSTPESLLLP